MRSRHRKCQGRSNPGSTFSAAMCCHNVLRRLQYIAPRCDAAFQFASVSYMRKTADHRDPPSRVLGFCVLHCVASRREALQAEKTQPRGSTGSSPMPLRVRASQQCRCGASLGNGQLRLVGARGARVRCFPRAGNVVFPVASWACTLRVALTRCCPNCASKFPVGSRGHAVSCISPVNNTVRKIVWGRLCCAGCCIIISQQKV